MDRRIFLKTSGIAAAALSVSSAFLLGSGCNSKGKIKMKWRIYELQLVNPFTIAYSTRKTSENVLVEMEYDGVKGYGEASVPIYLHETPETVMRFLREVDLSPFVPTQIDEILEYVDGLKEENTAAKTSIDIALHDLAGKINNQACYAMFGLKREDAPNTTYTIGIDPVEVIKEKTQAVAGKFKILKVKLGSDHDKEIIEAVRSVTDLPLCIDANQGWKNKEQALDMIAWLKEKGVVMVEQPMAKDDFESAAWITERSPLPIYADEAAQRLKDLERLKGAYNGFNIKIMKCTGLREAWKMIEFGRKNNLKVMIGCMLETSCANSAAAQLSPAADFADIDSAMYLSNDCFSGMKIVDGKITLPDAPGIGITLTVENLFA
ncbi:MAG: dipeptide epimerase [Dysgonamonadaceae bacterium]|jgi:L-alanine-DL-glutamate epimerase-like enolase superfamily enzyme|nr:dipeptide epimerase [Dysgonamonadaceae bacterium]